MTRIKLRWALVPSTLLTSLVAGSAWAQADLPWDTQIVNPPAAYQGKFASMATTKRYCNGNSGPLCQRIGVAYRDTEFNNLMYAQSDNNGATWQREIVTTAAEAGDPVGAHISLKFRPGPTTVPFIAYQKESNPTKLMFVEKTNTAGSGPDAWTYRQLNIGGFSTSMIFDGANKVRIAHLRSNGVLNYVTIPLPYSGYTSTDLNITAKAVRLETDDLKNKHLLWATDAELRYKMTNLDNPFPGSFEVVDDEVGAYPLNAIYRIAMTIDWQEYPHIAYVVPWAGGYQLRHAYKSTASDWEHEDVITFSSAAPQSPGLAIILDEDRDDTEAIAYGYSQLLGANYHRRQMISFRSGFGGWSGGSVDLAGGHYPNLARFFSGELAIAHFDPGAVDLRFVHE